MSIEPTPPAAWWPTPDDVATLLRARTKDDTGRELGTWTDATRPTNVEVQSIIELAARQTVSDEFAGPCERSAFAAINYRAACIVELSYFPEQVRSDRSPYEELKALADAALDELQTCISSGTSDGGDPGGEGYTYHSLALVPATTWAYYQGGGWGWRNPEFPSTWQKPCFAPTPETPARIDEPEPPPLPLVPIIVGHPAEGDVERGLPPIITGESSIREGYPPPDDAA